MLIGLCAILIINYYWTTVMAENSVTGNCLKAQVVCICLIPGIYMCLSEHCHICTLIV